MYQSILQKQKNSLLNLLPKNLVDREILKKTKKELNHNLIKLIVGPRRVGKSTLALQLLRNVHFGYANFDDPDFGYDHFRYEKLTNNIDEIYGKPNFILFDEIQNLPKWEVYLNSLQREGRNLIVTGSNAKMLSHDLASALTGRSIEIKLFPFSLAEAVSAGSDLKLEDYLVNGSYPETHVKNIEPETYYQSLFNTSIIKDIVIRHSIRNPQDLENTAKYLLSITANLYSYQALSRKLNFSVPTVIDYVKKLEETYLFYNLPKYSNKESEIVKSNKKIFIVDYALAKFNTPPLSGNYGAALENAVFVQLLRKGYMCGKSLYYYKTKNMQEVDFIAIEKDWSKSLYQVCFSVDDEKTISREVESLLNCESEIGSVKRKIIISKNIPGKQIHGIEMIDFLTFTNYSF